MILGLTSGPQSPCRQMGKLFPDNLNKKKNSCYYHKITFTLELFLDFYFTHFSKTCWIHWFHEVLVTPWKVIVVNRTSRDAGVTSKFVGRNQPLNCKRGGMIALITPLTHCKPIRYGTIKIQNRIRHYLLRTRWFLPIPSDLLGGAIHYHFVRTSRQN